MEEEEGSAEGAFIQVDEAGVITLCLHRLLLSLTGLETVEAEVVDVEEDGADTDDGEIDQVVHLAESSEKNFVRVSNTCRRTSLFIQFST